MSDANLHRNTFPQWLVLRLNELCGGSCTALMLMMTIALQHLFTMAQFMAVCGDKFTPVLMIVRKRCRTAATDIDAIFSFVNLPLAALELF